MASYLVELYLPRSCAGGLRAEAARARAAAEEAGGAGTPIRYIRSIFVPEDEICFHLYEGGSAASVENAIAAAGLAFERIVESEEERGAK